MRLACKTMQTIKTGAIGPVHLNRTWRRPFSTNFAINVAIVVFNAALIGVLWNSVFATLRTERADTIRAAIQKNDVLAVAFEYYATRTIESADATIRYMIREYARVGKDIDLAKFVADHTVESTTFSGVTLADVHGNAQTMSYAGTSVQSINVADRQHFRVHLNRDDGKVFIGKPVTSRITGKTLIPITRRINNPDGTFGGVAMAVIEPARFTEILLNADILALDVISLVGADGITRARLSGAATSSGEDIGRSPLFANAGRPAAGNYFATSVLDGVPRFYSYRTLSDYPLMTIVGAAESDVMDDFYRRQTEYFQAAGLMTAVISGFAALLMFALARQRRAAGKASRSDARMAAIIESSDDAIISKDLNGIISGWNAGAERLFGFTAAEMVGRSITQMIPPARKDEEEIILTRIKHGERVAHFETVRVAKDGRMIDVSITTSPVKNDAGDIIGESTVGRDITDRKQAEQNVRNYSGRLLGLSRKLLQVQEDERSRLARELHDQVGQALTALKINLQVIVHQPGAKPVALKIGECVQIADEAIQQVRTLVLDLRPPQLDELELAVALRTHAERLLTPANLALHFSAPPVPPAVPKALDIVCFRIMQESLTNVLRHAGARNVWIELAVDGDSLRLTVRDDGNGFYLAEAHRRALRGDSVGLLSMEERAALVDGRIEITTAPGKGATVCAIFPLQAQPTAQYQL
jgi:PAS domain S-box-containing protein